MTTYRYLMFFALAGMLAAAPLQALEWREASPGVRYVSGGVGFEEREEMKTRFANAALRIVNVVDHSGAYLADAEIVITSLSGVELLSATSDGPWFHVDLPAGEYRVSSRLNGAEQTRRISVAGQRLQDVIFRWKQVMPDPEPPVVPPLREGTPLPAPASVPASNPKPAPAHPVPPAQDKPPASGFCPPGEEFSEECL